MYSNRGLLCSKLIMILFSFQYLVVPLPQMYFRSTKELFCQTAFTSSIFCVSLFCAFSVKHLPELQGCLIGFLFE